MASPGSSAFRIVAASVLVCIVVSYGIYLHKEVLVILKMASGLRERRFEPRIIAGFFVVTVLVIPFCIVPSGLFFVMACLLAYVYGLAGWLIAWPAFSCGLMLVFSIGRSFRIRRDDALSRGGSTDFTLDAEELPEYLQGKTTIAILRGSRRLLREQPRRTCILLTFAMHSPSVQFLLGYASGVSCAENLAACGLDGSKSIVPILKGLVLADIVDVVAEKHIAGKSAMDDWRDYSTACVKLLICIAIGAMMFIIANAVKRELDEAEQIEAQGEHEHLLSRRLSTAATTSMDSQLGGFEGGGVEESEGLLGGTQDEA